MSNHLPIKSFVALGLSAAGTLVGAPGMGVLAKGFGTFLTELAQELGAEVIGELVEKHFGKQKLSNFMENFRSELGENLVSTIDFDGSGRFEKLCFGLTKGLSGEKRPSFVTDPSEENIESWLRRFGFNEHDRLKAIKGRVKEAAFRAYRATFAPESAVLAELRFLREAIKQIQAQSIPTDFDERISKLLDIQTDGLMGDLDRVISEIEGGNKEVIEALTAEFNRGINQVLGRLKAMHDEVREIKEKVNEVHKVIVGDNGREILKTPDAVIHYAPGWLEQEFRGRQDELRLLDKWLRDRKKRIMVIEAIGGTGKTMLTYHWLTNYVLTEGLQISPKLRAEIGLEKVFWWSIYESKVTFDKFLMDVLEANGVDTGKLAGKVGEMVDKVVGLCRKKKMLFVLDGFERMLVAYNRMDAAYLGDETADTSPKARQIYDEQVKRLVESFLDETIRSKLILTTRLMPSSRIESSRGIVEHLELKGLDRENAIAMLREVLPDAPKTELIAILERIGNDELGYHPLTIALVVGGLAVVPKNERLSEARKLVESLIADEEAFRGEMEELGITVSEPERYARARNHILHYCYDSMPENLREFASRLAALRGSIDFELAKVLATAEPVLFETDEEIKKVLRSLVRQRILMLSGDTYDFHPIVRKFFYSKLLNPKSVHEKLVEVFKPRADEAVHPFAGIFGFPMNIQSLTDLNPVIELYHHLIRAGKYDEAERLFYDRLSKLLYYRFGAYRLMIQLLSGLFEGGEVFDRKGNVRRLLLERDDYKAFVLNELANSYSLTGEPEKAVKLFEKQNALQNKLGNKKNLAIGLGNMAISLLKLGRICEAEAKLKERAEICVEIEDEFNESVAHQELGRLLGTIGKFGEAIKELKKAFDSFEKQGERQSQSIVEAHRALVSLMNAQSKDALEHAKRARKLADVVEFERDIIWSEWVLGISHLALNQLDEAERHFDAALKRCRRINMVDHEPDILLGIARLNLAVEKEALNKAKDLAEEALRIAENSKYRLKLADIHNFLAELELVRLGLVEPQLTHWGKATSKRKPKSNSLNREELNAAIEHLRRAAEFEIDKDIWEKELSESEREVIMNCEIPCDELSKRLTYVYLGACRRTQSLMKIIREFANGWI